MSIRDEERRTRHDATHHVFAARVAPALTRWDDDGEPPGTAGPPVLGELDVRGLVETVVVVTRWFGGTKLGTGGLARAYADAAARVLDEGRAREVRAAAVRHIRYGFEDTGAVARVLEVAVVVRGADEYVADREADGEPGVRTEVRVPAGGAVTLDRRLRDATAGRVRLEPVEDPERCWIDATT